MKHLHVFYLSNVLWTLVIDRVLMTGLLLSLRQTSLMTKSVSSCEQREQFQVCSTSGNIPVLCGLTSQYSYSVECFPIFVGTACGDVLAYKHISHTAQVKRTWFKLFVSKAIKILISICHMSHVFTLNRRIQN